MCYTLNHAYCSRFLFFQLHLYWFHVESAYEKASPKDTKNKLLFENNDQCVFQDYTLCCLIIYYLIFIHFIEFYKSEELMLLNKWNLQAVITYQLQLLKHSTTKVHGHTMYLAPWYKFKKYRFFVSMLIYPFSRNCPSSYLISSHPSCHFCSASQVQRRPFYVFASFLCLILLHILHEQRCSWNISHSADCSIFVVFPVILFSDIFVFFYEEFWWYNC